jgi:hypothetical protein
LDEIGLTINLFKESGGISKLQKPLKVYLENSNLMYALTSSAANTGNIKKQISSGMAIKSCILTRVIFD